MLSLSLSGRQVYQQAGLHDRWATSERRSPRERGPADPNIPCLPGHDWPPTEGEKERVGADTGPARSVDTDSGPIYGLILVSHKYTDSRSDVAANGQGCYVRESEYTNKKSIRMIQFKYYNIKQKWRLSYFSNNTRRLSTTMHPLSAKA